MYQTKAQQKEINMKISKFLIALLGCSFMLGACENTPKPNKIEADNDVVSIDDIVIEDDEDYEDPIEEKTCEEIRHGNCGGSLTDLLVGSYIEPNGTYTCSFSHSKTFSGEYTIKSDDRAIAQVSHEAGTNSFIVKGVTAGDAIIQAVSDDDEVVLQFVVHCRNRIPMNKLAKKLYTFC